MLDRYELLYEAGLIEEARRDGREAALARKSLPALGEPMRFDHRRILATAIARLRAKLKYRPVVFELMPREFTLTELQRTVEAISGRRLHKQNFRRLVENAALVEADRRDVDRDRRTAGGAVPFPPRRAGGTSGGGTAPRRTRLGSLRLARRLEHGGFHRLARALARPDHELERRVVALAGIEPAREQHLALALRRFDAARQHQ